MKHLSPLVGCWYKEINNGNTFEVVAVDDDSQTIETQYIDGEINEFELDSWNEMQLVEIEEPEDWRNAFELSQEDSLDPDAAIHPEEWMNPVNIIETDIINGLVDDL